MQVKYEPWGFKKEDESLWGIRILEGKFANTVISFNDVSLKEDGNSNLQLDYTVLKSPDDILEKYMSEDPDFQKEMGWIMEDILRKAINEYENRESNSAESDK